MPTSNFLKLKDFKSKARQLCTLGEQGVSKNRAGSTRGSGFRLTQPFLQEGEELPVVFAALPVLREDRVQAQR